MSLGEGYQQAPNHQCSRLKSSMPFKRELALQNIPVSKPPFKRQPRTENEDITWSPQYNPPATRTNKRRASSLQEVKLDGLFVILHIVLKTCLIQFMHKFNMKFSISFMYSWIDVLDLNRPFNWRAKLWEPSIWKKFIWELRSWPLFATLH